MALRGNLKDFSLPDVFQLVTFSRKTGVLRIRRKDDAEGSVWFRDGDVFFAQSNWHTEHLGDRLVKAQRITPQALKRALDLRAEEPEDGRRVGRILIDEGYITEKVLEAFVSEQIQDTIFDLMRWDEGDFDFETMPDVVDEDIGLSVSIENIVMEGARRLEEWTRIKKKIPSMDVVFKMATAPGEGTFEISLKPMEWQLLLLVDGTRSVAELATETNRTDFEVARIVYGLFSAGLLEFATDEEIERNRAERAERESRQAELEAARKAADQARRAEAERREAEAAREAAEREEAAAAAERAAADAREAAERVAADVAEAAAAEAARQAAAEAAAAEAAEPAQVPESTEVPEFLGGATLTPTADDQAVLEQFMGAILEQPAAEAAPEPRSEPAPTPYVPEEEPPFVAMAHDESAEDMVVAVPSVEDLLGLTPLTPAPQTAEEPEPEATPEPVVAPEPAPEAAPEAQLEPAPEPELAPEIVVEPVGSPAPAIETPPADAAAEPPADEFARDLMALGLGELPADLLSPLGGDAEAATEPVVAEEWGAAAAPVIEPAVEDAGVGHVAIPMSEREGAETPFEPASAVDEHDELAALSASLDLPADVPGEIHVHHEDEEAPDFSALLSSLDIDADAFGPVGGDIETEQPVDITPEDAGFDTELLMDEAPAPAGGVISTDAFLEDISIDDIGLSGSLNDELSALTGADRRGMPRPKANVNAIPEAGAGTLHRDTRVDRDTLLKIIDGIKNL